jgi:integrase
MASIHKDPRNRSPFWYAAFTLPDGTRCFKSTKLTDRKNALNMALDLERNARDLAEQDPTGAQISKIIRDTYERTTGKRLDVVLVGSYLRTWAQRAGHLKSKRTADRYGQVVDDFLSHLGETREKASLGSVTTNDVQEFIVKELASGKSPTTIAIVVKVLRIPFNQAFRHGIILKNPVSSAEVPEGHAEQRKVFTWPQVQMLIDAAEGDWKTAIMLSAYCGMRLGDCINLKWSNVDLDAGEITFIPEKTSRGKRRKELRVPIHAALREHLDKLAATDSPEQRLCPSLQGRSAGGRSGLSMEFINVIMRKAGVATEAGERDAKGKGRKFNKLSFHSLRHTFNSELANAGVSQEVRRILTGHASDKMNDKYSHFERKTLNDAVGKLPSR